MASQHGRRRVPRAKITRIAHNHVASGDHINHLAHVAWSVFYAELSRLGARTDYRARGTCLADCKYGAAFMAIAEVMDRAGVDVEEYVRESIDFLHTQRGMTPNPDALTGAGMLEAGARRGAAARGDASRAWDQQMHTLRDAASRMDPEQALLGGHTLFSAWFRVCAVDVPSDAVLELYGRLAWEEIGTDRLLRNFLRDKAPRAVNTLEQCYGRYID